jgi:hypothetical protein
MMATLLLLDALFFRLFFHRPSPTVIRPAPSRRGRMSGPPHSRIAARRLAAGRWVAVFRIRKHSGSRRLVLVDQVRLGVRTWRGSRGLRLRLGFFIVGHACLTMAIQRRSISGTSALVKAPRSQCPPRNCRDVNHGQALEARVWRPAFPAAPSAFSIPAGMERRVAGPWS